MSKPNQQLRLDQENIYKIRSSFGQQQARGGNHHLRQKLTEKGISLKA